MIGDNIRHFREKAGLSQTQLAEKLNVVRQTVSKWEQGKSVPDAEMCKSLAKTFNIPVSDLFSEAIPPQDSDEMTLQLSLLNEQLRTANEHRAFWKGVVLRTVAVLVALPILGWILITFFN